MTAIFHLKKNARHPTLDARRSSIFTFGVQRSAFNVRRSSPTPNSSLLTPNSARTRAAAFTLVETALALLAISLGLLGIFGLARHGLKNGGDTENETRCTLLADTVFETLKAKNNELAEKKVSLYDWWFYWITLIGKTDQPSLFLPIMPEISADGQPVGIAVGSRALNAFLQNQTTFTEVKWNPIYSLSLTVTGIGNLTSINDLTSVYELGEIYVSLSLHPGLLQGGSEARTYYTVLTYTGGLP